MKIYELDIDVDNFRTCFIKETSLGKKELRSLNKGVPVSLGDNTINFVFDKECNNPIGNVYLCWDMRAFLVDKVFYDLFSKIEDSNIQFIELQDNFYLFNNLTVIDALDVEKTEFKTFEDIIIGVEKPAFLKQQYPFLFQVIEPTGFVVRDYYVTDEFKKIIEDNNIKGFLFKELWDSEK